MTRRHVHRWLLPVLALLLIVAHVVVLRHASARLSLSAMVVAGVAALLIILKYVALRHRR